MKRAIKLLIVCFCAATIVQAQNYPTGKSVLAKVTQNMTSKTRIAEARMEIAGARGTRIMQTKTWSEGEKKSFIEVLAPEKEKGTKMLKIDKQLWIYSPKTKRSIQISGQMLRQSMLGSDLSYEDMMNDSPLQQKYSTEVTGEETIDGRKCWILTLTAVKEGLNYHTQKMWIDQERYVPLRTDMFSKSGKLLKRLEMSGVERTQGRWFPKTMVYKDMLKEGKDTRMTIISIQFDVEIPASVFEKTNLK